MSIRGKPYQIEPAIKVNRSTKEIIVYKYGFEQICAVDGFTVYRLNNQYSKRLITALPTVNKNLYTSLCTKSPKSNIKIEVLYNIAQIFVANQYVRHKYLNNVSKSWWSRTGYVQHINPTLDAYALLNSVNKTIRTAIFQFDIHQYNGWSKTYTNTISDSLYSIFVNELQFENPIQNMGYAHISNEIVNSILRAKAIKRTDEYPHDNLQYAISEMRKLDKYTSRQHINLGKSIFNGDAKTHRYIQNIIWNCCIPITSLHEIDNHTNIDTDPKLRNTLMYYVTMIRLILDKTKGTYDTAKYDYANDITFATEYLPSKPYMYITNVITHDGDDYLIINHRYSILISAFDGLRIDDDFVKQHPHGRLERIINNLKSK